MSDEIMGRNLEIYAELNTEALRRRDEATISKMDELSRLYENELPGKYDQYFPSGTPKHVVGLTKLAQDDLATSIGRVPDFRGDPLKETDQEQRRVGKLERIAHSYLRRAEPSAKEFMWDLAWWLLIGRAIAIVKPGKDEHGQWGPQFSLRDPRTAHVNIRRVNNRPVEVYDIIFENEIPLRDAVAQGLASQEDLDKYSAGGPWGGDGIKIKTYELIDDQQWVIASEKGYYKRAEHGLGTCPAWVFQTFSPNRDAGLSLFEDQLSFQVAISLLMSYKLAAADRQVNPIYWAKGHVGTVKLGPNVMNKLTTAGDIGKIDPPNLGQVDRDIEQLLGLSRILNRNPEVRQGEVNAKGAYTSAKTLEQLDESIDTVIGRNWDTISRGLQHLIRLAFTMDEQLWPDEEKHITTNIKNKTYRDTYVPSKDINGHYHISVDYGFGVGGYQGFLQHLQANQAKMMSRRRVIEVMPGVSDVDKEMREIELDEMDEAGRILFQSQAASGQMDVMVWAEMRQLMAEKGISLHEATLKMEERIRKQAQESVEMGGADALSAAPAPTPDQPQEAPLPGVPPAALAGTM